MDIYPDKRKVISLVEQAHNGKLSLPNLQRDFVWSREGVADPLRSILRGYFIGSLLLLRSDPQKPPFAPVLLRGAKSPLAADELAAKDIKSLLAPEERRVTVAK
jgi:hypothetical protein